MTLTVEKFLEMLPQRQLQPKAEIVALFKLILRSAHRQEFDLEPGHPDCEVFRFAGLRLISILTTLNDRGFWAATSSQLIRRQSGKVSVGNRERKLAFAKKLLSRESASHKTLLKAMDIIDEVSIDMLAHFADALLPEEAKEDDAAFTTHRYKIAALLEPMRNRFEKVWLPLRTRLLWQR